MKLSDRLRHLFSFSGPDEEAAEREEYDLPDEGEAEVERDRFAGPFATIEAADTAKEELDELKPPPDPNP
jgi:hypothetical protein